MSREIVQMLNEKRGPGGDLYLTKTHADHLVRWIEIAGREHELLAASVEELQKIMKMTEPKSEPNTKS